MEGKKAEFFSIHSPMMYILAWIMSVPVINENELFLCNVVFLLTFGVGVGGGWVSGWLFP